MISEKCIERILRAGQTSIFQPPRIIRPKLSAIQHAVRAGDAQQLQKNVASTAWTLRGFSCKNANHNVGAARAHANFGERPTLEYSIRPKLAETP
jgi:hypothetical protein